MRQGVWPVFVCVAVVAVGLTADPALAGPGGKIASAVFESFVGRIALVALVILLAPLIVYFMIKERRAQSRAIKDLVFMAQHAPQFELVNIRQRATDCIQRVYAAWSKEQVGEASRWMTNWYWQNQQLVHIDRWEREGLVNVCNLKELKSLNPVLFVHRNDGAAHEGSIIVLSVAANMQDYLAQRGSGEVVEGSTNFMDVFTAWTLTLTGGQWLVSNIESGSGLQYADMAKQLPPIEATLWQPRTV